MSSLVKIGHVVLERNLNFKSFQADGQTKRQTNRQTGAGHKVIRKAHMNLIIIYNRTFIVDLREAYKILYKSSNVDEIILLHILLTLNNHFCENFCCCFNIAINDNASIGSSYINVHFMNNNKTLK